MKTDTLISCGISNWGGYALLAGVALAKGRLDILEKVTSEQEETVLDYLVCHGPAIDGITCKPDHSVDGIEFDDYMKVIERIKEIAFENAAGHQLFFKPTDDWFEPVVSWLKH